MIKVGELAVEVEHGLGESHDRGGGGRLAGNVDGLPAGGFDGGVGKPACAADSAPLQPSRQPSGTQLADRCRDLKAADEDQRVRDATSSLSVALRCAGDRDGASVVRGVAGVLGV
jgi:hypothetical protein